MQGAFLTRLVPRCQSGILFSMEIEPLKIPAFMRKKSLIRKDNSNFYKESEKSSTPTPSTPERSRVRFTLPTPAPSAPEQPRIRVTPSTPAPYTPARPRSRIVSQTPFPDPFMMEPEQPRFRFTSPTPAPAFSIPAPVTPRPARPEPVFTPVGVVTHYLDKIKVVIVKLDADVRVGDRLVLNGENGPFKQKLKSMQINRQNVETASPGDDIGIKVSKKAVVGETIYVIG